MTHSGSLWLIQVVSSPLWFPLPLFGFSGSYWLSPCLSLSLSGSLWFSVTPTVAPAGSIWLSLSLYGFLQLSLWLPLALTGSLWLSRSLCDSHSGFHWLSPPLSDLLWPSQAHYCSLILLIQSLIGSQGSCSAISAAATLTHFAPVWSQTKCLHLQCNGSQTKFYTLIWLAGLARSKFLIHLLFLINNDMVPLHVQTRRPFTGIIGVRLLRDAFFFKLNFPEVGFCSNTLLFFLLQSCALSIPGAG